MNDSGLGDFVHVCPFNGDDLIDEHDDAIIHCRCYWSREFLDAQDRRAVAIDAGRTPEGQAMSPGEAES